MRYYICTLLAVCTISFSYEDAPDIWWVFFTDRGPDLQHRLIVRTAELAGSPSWERRRSSGLICADELDLEPWPDYVEAVESAPVCHLVRTSSRYLNAISVEITGGDAEQLLELPFVEAVRPVAASTFRMPELRPISGRTAGVTDGQLSQIGLDLLHERGWTGGGVVVGVLDSGFDLDHDVFSDIQVLAMYDFVDDDPDPSQQPGDPEGQSNHGTAVLSIIGGYKSGEYQGGAHDASFILAKTEDISDEYQAEEDYWVAGLEWIESQGGQLVNSSLAYMDWYTYPDLDGNTAVTTIAADAAASRGLVVYNSIGNEGPDEGTLLAPADGDSVFASGAVDISGNVTQFSSRGPTWDGRTKPDGCALGQAVALAGQGTSVYSLGSGTSFSSPLTASAAAALSGAHPEWDMVEIMTVLRATASRSDSPDNVMGYGILDAYAALKYMSVTGHVRFSISGDPAAEYPLTITLGDSIYDTETNESGWFAFSPGELGEYVVSDGGGSGYVIPVSGTLSEDGVEIEVFVDREPGLAPPSVFPNPSSSGVYVGFDLPDGPMDVELSIYDITGQLLHHSVRSGIGPGSFRAPLPEEAFYWDGSCEDGSAASSGIYIVSLRTGDSIVLLKSSLVR